MSADTVGGVWSYALELAAGLGARGDSVLLAAMGGRMSRTQREEAAAVPGLVVADSAFRLEWMENPWRDLERAESWLLALARDFQPDLVHLNHYAHGALPWDVPTVVVAHSCVYSWYRAVRRRLPEARWRRYRQAVRRGLRSADMVVAPTLAMLAEAERYYGPFRRARVIYNGRRSQGFAPARKERLILCAGRLWDEAKNVSALARIAPRLPWKVALAGDLRGPDGRVGGLSAVDPPGGETALPGVELLGRLPAQGMAQALARAGIYCLPARYEPFGLSVLEAALSGCALVLGEIDSLQELWDGAALFVRPDDSEGLAEALGRLARDPELRQAYAERARDRAADYGAASMTDGYRALYGQLLEEAAHPVRLSL